MEAPGEAGVISRIRGWVIAAAATSLVASLATMPFALHHFDRAALFSVLANIVSTPVITLWTTPAAALAAIAAPVGFDEPFLWLMGKSLEVVLFIAHYSVETSPEMDLPRLGAVGMALAAVAIALFCVFKGRGRAFAIVPAMAAITVWLTAPQATGYVADDGSVFLQGGAGWFEMTDWRGRNGLNPLIIGDKIIKAPCPGKGAACEMDVSAGRATVEPSAASGGDDCPSSAALRLQPARGDSITVHPCTYVGQGGAAIDQSADQLTIRPAQMQNGRAWAQPLYAKPRKPDQSDNAQ